MRIVTCTDGLPVRDGNPHLWMDPEFARAYVRKIRDAFVERDPAVRAEYARNAGRYDARSRAQREIPPQIATIPPAQRTMIVFHNAWKYYNARFGVKTVGVDRDVARPRAESARSRRARERRARMHVRAVFAEPEYSPKLVQALAESARHHDRRKLYDDSIGTDPRVADYDERCCATIRDTIVESARRPAADGEPCAEPGRRARSHGALRSRPALDGVEFHARRGRSARHRRAERVGKIDAAQERSPGWSRRRAVSSRSSARRRARSSPARSRYVPQIEAVDWTFPASVWRRRRDGALSAHAACSRDFRSTTAAVVRACARGARAWAICATGTSRSSPAASSSACSSRARSRRSRACLLLDEPTTGVDAATEEALRELVRGLGRARAAGADDDARSRSRGRLVRPADGRRPRACWPTATRRRCSIRARTRAFASTPTRTGTRAVDRLVIDVLARAVSVRLHAARVRRRAHRRNAVLDDRHLRRVAQTLVHRRRHRARLVRGHRGRVSARRRLLRRRRRSSR